MVSLTAINKEIRKSGKKNTAAFLDTFLTHEDRLLTLMKSYEGVKSEIYLQNIDQQLNDYLSFSAIFSDITLLNTAPSAINSHNVSYFQPGHKHFRERQLTIPPKYVFGTGIDPKRFLPCYCHRNDEEIRKLFVRYSPFVKTERLVIRPLRSLYVSFPEEGRGDLYYVNPNTGNDHWYIDDKEQYEFITIDNGLSLDKQVALFELTIPYICGVEIERLSNILVDETDLLAGFRVGLKKLINQTGEQNATRIEDIQQDIIRPEIEKMERKFKRIRDSHRTGIGVTVGSFSLTLVLSTLAGSNILQVLSAAGIGALTAMINSNNNYFDKIGDIRDNPFYLLWQIRRIN